MSGVVRISGRLAKFNDGGSTCGDGVLGYILVDGVQIWSRSIGASDTTGISYAIDASVNTGSNIDFVVTPQASGFCDHTIFTSTIVRPTSLAYVNSLSVVAPATLQSSGQATLSASAGYSDSTSKTITPTWTSSNPTVANISSTGILAAGRVTADTLITITATYTENSTTVTASQTITILAAGTDIAPSAFSFPAVTDAVPASTVTSAPITIQGIDRATSISISGGEYSINSGTWTSAAGTVSLGNQVQVRLTAPAGYGQSAIATLTIGGVSASFKVTTLPFTPVASASEVFSNPQTATVVDGIVRVTQAPTAPLQLATGAVQNAVIAIDTASAVPVVSGGATLNYTRESSGTTLQVRNIGGSSALAPISGSVSIEAPGTGSTIPLIGSSNGSAVVQTTVANTRVSAGPDENRNLVLAVTSGGKVTYQSSSGGRALPSSFDLYPGEAVLADEAGTAGQVRLGSRAQTGSQAGDFITNLPQAAKSLSVPRISGNSERFATAWSTLVGQAIATKLGLGTATSLTQDTSSGVMTLITSQGTYRFLPVGSLSLADAALGTTARAVSVADIAANLTAILDSSLSFAVAPATAYADLETALKNINSSASLEILGDGVILAKLAGTDYIAQPASQTTTGSSSNCPGFVTENNQLALCDATGKRQVLNAAFADADTLRDTFRSALALPTLSVSNTGTNGVYSAIVGGTPYSLSPEITLTAPPPSQAGNLWWSDTTSGKFFIRYPSGQAQGFGLR